MVEVLYALGRGLIKVLISVVLGAGGGMLTFALAGADKSGDMWRRPEPPMELFLGIGVGLLVTGVLLMAFFFLGRRREALPPARPDASPFPRTE